MFKEAGVGGGELIFDDMMDFLVDTDSETEATAIENEEDNDDNAFENPKCGICVDVVIDRGGLDCCQHWFCFACIDNWATITNLCPLCKKEFQLITCLPVYDTIGGINYEEQSISRDEEWCVEGRNNTLSFPSYYINEDAVVCLHGDGCKLRNGFSTSGGELNVDTSIACDSCDIWYHAFCVGFDPQCTSDSSWLCPRCMTDGVPKESDGELDHSIVKHSQLKHADLGWSVGCTFSGRVSVSMSDTGDTDVVVSMVEEKQKIQADENVPNVDAGIDEKTGINLVDLHTDNAKTNIKNAKGGINEVMHSKSNSNNTIKLDVSTAYFHNFSEVISDLSPEAAMKQPDIHPKEEFVVMQPTQGALSDVNVDDDLRVNIIEGKFNTDNVDGNKIPGPCLTETTVSKDDVSEIISVGNVHPCPFVADTSPMNLAIEVMHQNSFEDSGLVQQPPSVVVDASLVNNQSRKRERDMERKMEVVHPLKKVRSEARNQLLPLDDQSPGAVSDDANSECVPDMHGKPPDIMTIVQEDDRSKRAPAGSSSVDRSKRDGGAGLRMKKIMRRSCSEKESSELIQKLGKEIREAVQDKDSDIIDKENILGGELLTAFRAALAKPPNELGKSNGSHMGIRKPILERGKTRSNLTRKIYGTSTGRRRRAWDRDCEVEFWKRRCSRTNPEKVETLQSVLELLKQASSSCSNNAGTEQDSGDTRDSILSRVYLADASVFPRKVDDIKPLCDLKGLQPACESKMPTSRIGKSGNGPYDKVSSSNNEGKSSSALSSKRVAPFRKENSNGSKAGPMSMSASSSSKGAGPKSKEPPRPCELAETDKRKWALEVLARKSALTSMDANKGNQEDSCPLKANYPLLAQLPSDMRPVLATTSHNKVPLSVRQAQLHRIAEHFLRRTNLSAIYRTAVTELAIADAINIEKDISERSNSKLVYINLCSRVLSQHKTESQTSENVTSASMTPIEVANLAVEETANPVATTSSTVEEALRLAGLIDSPPNSPGKPMKSSEEDADSMNAAEASLHSVLDMDSHSTLHVHGGFKSDLKGDGNSCSSRMTDVGTTLSSQPEDGESGVEILSKQICEKPDSELDSQNSQGSKQESVTHDHHYLKVVEASSDSSTLLKCQDGSGNAGFETIMDVPLLREPYQVELHKEASVAECVELCGPDSKPLRRTTNDGVSEPSNTKEVDKEVGVVVLLTLSGESKNCESKEGTNKATFDAQRCAGHNIADSKDPSVRSENASMEGATTSNSNADTTKSISMKVESYVKEHIRPLCKSGVITMEQYRWSVAKTTEKVMKFHCKAKNANFLIKEGAKVKKLAEDYVEAAQQKHHK